MARPQLQPKADRSTTAFHAGAPATTYVLVVVVFVTAAAVAAIVVSLCTSGKNARPRKQRRSSLAPAPQELENNSGGRSKPQLLASLSGIGVKAAVVAKMVSWNRRSPPGPEGGWSGGSDDDNDVAADDGALAEDEEALWKKTIIMGDKCRPLEFSGHIAYGSDGNSLQPPTPAPAKEDAAAGATDLPRLSNGI